MFGQIVEIAVGILILTILIRVSAFIRQYTSPEDVIHLLGDALSLKVGSSISKQDDRN